MKDIYKRYTIMIISLVMCFVGNVARAGLISLWNFDYGDATDIYGDNHGTLVGDPKWVQGKIGGALEFDGSQCIVIENESCFDITKEITVSLWIKVKLFDKQWQAIITKGDQSWRLARLNFGDSLAFHLNGLKVVNAEEGHPGIDGNVGVNDGKWHHVAGVYDGSKVYLYVDGNLDMALEASGTIASNNRKVYIGENSELSGRYFNGLIDDVAIFDHALTQAEVKRLYQNDAKSFIPESYLATLAKEAQEKIEQLPPKQAVEFIEDKITEYERWKVANLENIRPCDRCLSCDIYYLLAKAKKKSGARKEDITETYIQSVSQIIYRAKHVPDAISWLYENVATKEYINIVRKCVRNDHVLNYDLYQITKHLQSLDKWDELRVFLDGVFSTVDYKGLPTSNYAKVVTKALEQDSIWSARFAEYCRSKPELTEYVFQKQEEAIKQYIAKEDYQNAAGVYQEILKQCGPNQNISVYEFRLCRCLFDGRKFNLAVGKLDSFIETYKSVEREKVCLAIMLKARSCVNLGEIGKATDAFVDLLIEYPDSQLAEEANFLAGYCCMLQENYREATEAFRLLTKDYPNSDYTGKAESYLMRLEEMTK